VEVEPERQLYEEDAARHILHTSPHYGSLLTPDCDELGIRLLISLPKGWVMVYYFDTMSSDDDAEWESGFEEDSEDEYDTDAPESGWSLERRQ
jgi:hypothetical protein